MLAIVEDRSRSRRPSASNTLAGDRNFEVFECQMNIARRTKFCDQFTWASSISTGRRAAGRSDVVLEADWINRASVRFLVD